MLQVNERLGDFEIIRLLGKGGMGEVYEARQLNPDRRVAIKVLAPWLARDDESLRRFWKEAEVPANLDHPGIVRIISTGKTADGVAYFAMHLVRGISLAEMIRRVRSAPSSEMSTRTVDSANTPSAAPSDSGQANPPPTPLPAVSAIPPLMQEYRHDRFMTVARIGAQAANALAYAHDQGFLHRDIKPSNLMVDHHDLVYLVDFGLTRALVPAADGTQVPTLLGTPWYMSPEQADVKPIDQRSDIYSLGVTLYELATQGDGPFTADREERHAVLAQVRAGQTLPLRTLAPGIPARLEQIIVRAMQHKPKRRYATAAEMARDLEAFCGISGKPSSHLPARQARQDSRRRWPAMLGVAVLGVVLIAAALLVVRPWQEKAGANIGPLDGASAEPPSLRTAPADTAMALLRGDLEPLWYRKIGPGNYNPWSLPGKLDVVSFAESTPTFLLLGNPDRRDFEYAVALDVTVTRPPSPVKNYGGLVFGWQHPEHAADGPRVCFAIQIDNTPSALEPNGRAIIGYFSVVPPTADRGGSTSQLVVLPAGKAVIPFLHPPPKWRHVKVKVRDQEVLVDVDGAQGEFTMSWLREQLPFLPDNLGPQGGVGVWAQLGSVGVKDATIKIMRR